MRPMIAEKFDGDLQKGNIPTLILGVLAEGPLHGYGIAREIRQRSEDAFRLGEGTLYPVLKTLETAGLIEGSWEIQPSGPARKVYTLTDAGRGELASRRRRWEQYTRVIGRILGGVAHERPA